MTGYAVTAATGRLHANEVDLLWTPHVATPNRCGVVLCHQYAALASDEFDNFTLDPQQSRIAADLCEAGFTVAAGDFGGGTAFGNDTAVSRVAEAATYLASLGCRSDRVLLVGVSMGALTAFSYARANPSSVAAMCVMIPASDLDDLRDNNRLGTRDPINAAWGLAAGSTSSTVALPAQANPVANGNTAPLRSAGIPWLGLYSSGDTVVLPSTVTNLATLLGPTASTTVVSSTDHSDAALASVTGQQIATFLQPYA